MNSRARIKEIDITKQARALACLRMTDYVLVVACSSLVVELLSEMLFHSRSDQLGVLAFQLVATGFLCFAVYTGWRHVGVIDPAVWRAYRAVFPLLGISCLVLTGISLANYHKADLEDKELTIGIVAYGWIAGVSLLGWISLMLLRRMKIDAMGTTVDRVLSRLGQEAGINAVQTADIKRINKPRGYLLGAAGAVILLALILAPTPKNKAMADALLRASQQIRVAGLFLLLRARRYFQVDADSLLAVDQRPPILFLRSFDDDEKEKLSRSDKAFLDFSLEMRLSNHFSRFGPFIAIGSPKETVPQLGAARVLLSDNEWQPRVLSWMREARLIVMYSGKTHWVNWELRKLLENGCTTRLILLVPEIKGWRRSKRTADLDARVQHLREVFQSTPWEEELWEFNDFAGLRAMLFRPDGSMVMVKSRSRSRDSYHLAALVAHEILLEHPEVVLGGKRTPMRAAVDGSSATGLLQGLRPALSLPTSGSAALAPEAALAPPARLKVAVAPAPMDFSAQNRLLKYFAGAAAAAFLILAVGICVYLWREKQSRLARLSQHPQPAVPAAATPYVAPAPPPAVPEDRVAPPANPPEASRSEEIDAGQNQDQEASNLSRNMSQPPPERPTSTPQTPAQHVTQQQAPEEHIATPPAQAQSMTTQEIPSQDTPAQQPAAQPPAIQPPVTIPPPPPPPDPTIAMAQNAQAAMNAGRLIEPQNDSALYWALRLRQYGNPQGAIMEKYVLEKVGRQIDGAVARKNYDAALRELNQLMEFYPASPELISLRSRIESEQQRQAAAAQVRQFVLQHRHVIVTNNGNIAQAYCVGVLTVAPDGSARFDCTLSFDPTGRCDHVVFPGGSIKEVKFLGNGLLHVATNHMGNYDFYGPSGDLQGAYQGLVTLARK